MRIKIQTDKKDCGLIVLQAFYKKFYKKWLDINYLKSQVKYSDNGINLLEISQLAKKLGLNYQALEGDFESFKNLETNEPFFILINNNNYFHYVIVEEKTNGYLTINDPFKGKYKLTYESLKPMYLNIIIYVNKISSYSHTSLSLNGKFNYFNNQTINIIVATFLSLINISLVFAGSYYLKNIVDNVIPTNNNKYLITLTILFGWISIIKIISSYLLNLMEQKIYQSIEKNILKNFFIKVLNGKTNSLHKIQKSDYFHRLSTIQNVTAFYTNIIEFLFNKIIVFILSTILLTSISWRLYLISLVIYIISFIVSYFFKRKIIVKYQNVVENNISLINQNVEIFFSFLQRKDYYNRKKNIKNFETFLSEYQTKSMNFWKISNWKKIFLSFITSLMQIIVIFIGSKFVLNKLFTLGQLLLFNSIFIFSFPMWESLAEIFSSIDIDLKNIERLNYILLLEEEQKFYSDFLNKKIESIEFKDIKFGYTNKIVLNNFSWLFLNNTQIVGKNGTGKSTIMKLIYGLNSDYQGKILVNNKNLNDINLAEFRKNIFLNDVYDYLPNDFLINIITSKDEVAMKTLNFNIAKYNLNDLLNGFNLKWDTKIEDGGIFLSNGQKQFIGLLKLFCFKYELIMFDEAFESIESEIFNKIKKAIILEHENALFIEISHTNRIIASKNCLKIPS
ncbi:Mbov_0121 family peptidase domain-containing ABC transporter [Metamycoplasma buccale]|uniref:Mbov_0121 family peptidase domain-containing ABC transporter n=1 Tax=Metamycoplasma buccale TaxID=55602 RepID=UPI00398E6543